MEIVPLFALSTILSDSTLLDGPGATALAQGDLGVKALLFLSTPLLSLTAPELTDLAIALDHGTTTRLARPAELVLLERRGANTVPFPRADVEFESAGCGWEESGLGAAAV
jgi:hypothetical protein